MKYPKLRELREVVKALIKGPYTVRYPQEPANVYEGFRGRPYFHEDDCIGCGACANVCPAKAIDVTDSLSGKNALRKLTVRWDICICCGQCEANCLSGKGIILSKEFDYSVTENREGLANSVEKELIFCECCNKPVLPFDQYVWITRKLGALSFTNSSLMLFYLRILGFASKLKAASRKREELRRSDRIKIICPACRREAVLKS